MCYGQWVGVPLSRCREDDPSRELDHVRLFLALLTGLVGAENGPGAGEDDSHYVARRESTQGLGISRAMPSTRLREQL